MRGSEATEASADILAKQGRFQERIKSWRWWALAYRSRQGNDGQCILWVESGTLSRPMLCRYSVCGQLD